jgi:hypothetical protein
MCRRVTCNTCNKPTWAGCGAHIEQVLGDVPKAQRCSCREKPKSEAKPGAAATPESTGGGFFKRLFGGK